MRRAEFYKRVFDEALRLSDDGFIVVDDRAIVTDINDLYSNFLGKPKEEIIGHPITDVIPNSKMPDIMKNEYREELALHKYVPGYVRDAKNDFVLVSRTFVKDSRGNIIGGVAQVHFRDQSVESARRMLKEYNELEFLREQYAQFNESQPGFNDIIGSSEIIQQKKREAVQASKTNFSVLITGESGTGKEVFARAIHYASGRSHRPFVSVNCAAIPSELLESELFGYEEGAFTGAKKGGRKGKFIQADGGTIFLDEIGDMPLVMQAKLLRALQEREVDTVGGTTPVPVDIRVISATRKNLEQMILEGSFREDLYYRLNVINISLPPLRERRQDIPLLVGHYMTLLNREYKKNVTKALVIAEIAKVDASLAEVLSVHTLSSDIILTHGTEEQKQKYLTKACTGAVGAFALTEPGAGSDAAAAKTKAIADGDDYIINGSKCFISNMGPDEGDYVILIALTEPEKKTKGMSAIIVDRGTPGFTLGKTENKMGLRAAPVSELIFEDCRVPKSQLLGQEGRGFMIAMAGLDGGRIGMAAQAVGVAQGAIAAAVEYTGQRIQFGKPINANQGIQWYLADMATTTEASLLLTMNAAKIRDESGNCGCEAAMAKYFASENAVAVCNKALQLHGGYGYMKDYAIERMYRDARIIPLYEGTSEVQKMVISRNVIK